MRELALAAVHEAADARFTEAAGWRVALDYEDPGAEQRAVRASAGLIDWSARGKVRVAGAEALPFLDNLLTNDLSGLRPGDGLPAALLERKGHVVGDLAVYRRSADFLLGMEPEVAGRVFDGLAKHLISDDATLDDVVSEFGILGIFGPQSEEIVRHVLGTSPPTAAYAHAPAAGLLVARSPYFGGEGYEVWIPAEADASQAWRRFTEAGATPFGLAAAEALRIEAGRPKSGVDMDETTLALEARLEPVISMTKGCYLGQEVVARIVNQGHVNRILVGFDVEGEEPPAHGDPVAVADATVGSVTSAARSEALQRVLALGYVRREHATPGTGVTIAGRPARVAALPFR